MPIYQNNPFQKPILALKGVGTYLFGSFDYKAGDTRLYVTYTQLTSNVATVTVQQVVGPAVVVGSYISIINSTSTSGLFNVNRAIITATTVDATTGAGTITFALTHANVTTGADTGTVFVEPAEVGETLTTGTFSVACLYQAPDSDSQFTIPMAVTFPTMPTAATVTLQVAIKNENAEYTNTTSVVTVAGSAYTAGPVVEATLQRGYLYRLAVTGVTGSGTIVAKLG